MADIAVSREDVEYGRLHYAVRASLYAKFIGGDMQPRPLGCGKKTEVEATRMLCILQRLEAFVD